MTAWSTSLLPTMPPPPGTLVVPGVAVAEAGFLDFLAAALDGAKPEVPAQPPAPAPPKAGEEQEPESRPPLACAPLPSTLVDPHPVLEDRFFAEPDSGGQPLEPVVPLPLASVPGAPPKDAEGRESLERGAEQEQPEDLPEPALQVAPVVGPAEAPRLSPLPAQQVSAHGERGGAPVSAPEEPAEIEAWPKPGVRREDVPALSSMTEERSDPAGEETVPVAFRARIIPARVDPDDARPVESPESDIAPVRRAGVEAPPIRQRVPSFLAKEIVASRPCLFEPPPVGGRSLSVDPAGAHPAKPLGNAPLPAAIPENLSPVPAPRPDGRRVLPHPDAVPAPEAETAVPKPVPSQGHREPWKPPACEAGYVPAAEPVKAKSVGRLAEPPILPVTDLPRPPAASPDKAAGRPAPTAAQAPSHLEEPPVVRRGPVAREVTLRIPVPGTERVEVSVRDRAGEVHVAVRTRDAELAKSLRAELPELVQSLKRRGFHAETWRPPGGEHAAPGAQREGRIWMSDPPPEPGRESRPGAGHGDGSDRQGQHHHRRRGEPEARFEIPAILSEQEEYV